MGNDQDPITVERLDYLHSSCATSSVSRVIDLDETTPVVSNCQQSCPKLVSMRSLSRFNRRGLTLAILEVAKADNPHPALVLLFALDANKDV